jgi:hypothetical protein
VPLVNDSQGIQSRVIAPEIQDVLTLAGGLNLYGEPRFRAVWGWNRLTWIGGEWADYTDSGIFVRTVTEEREVPKYHPRDCWYIEKYCPPEMYGSRAAWEAQTVEHTDGKKIRALGPFPERGDYELSWRAAVPSCPRHVDRTECLPSCEAKTYWFPIELTCAIAEEYVGRVMASEKYSDAERLAAIKREQQRQRQETDRINADILHDVSPYNKGSYVVVPGMNKSLEDWRKGKGRAI